MTARPTRGTRDILAGCAGVVLIFLGVPRLAADIIDIPGNPAAAALADGEFVNTDGIALVLESRTDSLKRDLSAARWFTLGRARLAAGDAEASARAFAEGLVLAPANGVVWAEYARALRISGDMNKAALARAYSLERAPHDPRATRSRRPRR